MNTIDIVVLSCLGVLALIIAIIFWREFLGFLFIFYIGVWIFTIFGLGAAVGLAENFPILGSHVLSGVIYFILLQIPIPLWVYLESKEVFERKNKKTRYYPYDPNERNAIELEDITEQYCLNYIDRIFMRDTDGGSMTQYEIDKKQQIKKVFNNPESKEKINFHGGCLGCISPSINGIGRCKGCQYMLPNWSLPELKMESNKNS